jgi:hypothetical protein
MTRGQNKLVKALREAEHSFDKIRRTLIKNLNEPESSGFWEAVKARDAIRAALSQPDQDPMTTMTDIPDDILEKAQASIAELDPFAIPEGSILHNSVVRSVAAAIQSERETMVIAFEANLNEMSQRFRAVNIGRVIEQSGTDFVALSERLKASEARVAELEDALTETLDGYINVVSGNCSSWDSTKDDHVIATRAALAKQDPAP